MTLYLKLFKTLYLNSIFMIWLGINYNFELQTIILNRGSQPPQQVLKPQTSQVTF